MKAFRIAPALALATALFAVDPAVQQAKKQIGEKKYDEAITSLETAYKKNPKAADVKQALGDAWLAKGDSYMADASMPPRMKYPGALKAYRQVLTYDKTNKKA